MKPLLLYLHGFNSSPASYKARIMAQAVTAYRPDIQLLLPQLPVYPNDVVDMLEALLESERCSTRAFGIIGSSLGGYFATYLAQKYDCKAVIINPAVKPYELLKNYLGPGVHPFTHEKYLLEKKHMGELKALETESIEAERFWLLQQEGDEVLDYREAVLRYTNAQITLEPNGDHHFVGFERFPQQILSFLHI